MEAGSDGMLLRVELVGGMMVMTMMMMAHVDDDGHDIDDMMVSTNEASSPRSQSKYGQ